MANKYGLSEVELSKIRLRDRKCVYCQRRMHAIGSKVPRTRWATIEHFNRRAPWNNHVTVGICCWSCNSSRGQKKLADWFKTAYCVSKQISEKSVAPAVREFMRGKFRNR